MKTFERIIEKTACDYRTEFWLCEQTMNSLFAEADKIKVEEKNLVMSSGGEKITICTGAGMFLPSHGMSFYRLEEVENFYQRNHTARVAVEIL